MSRNNNRRLLHLNQAGADQLLQFRQNRIHLLARLNELDLDRQMIRNLEDVRGMNAMLNSKARNTFDHCGACDSTTKKKVENRRVNRNVMVRGSVAQVEQNFYSLACSQHGFCLRSFLDCILTISVSCLSLTTARPSDQIGQRGSAPRRRETHHEATH